MTPSNERTNTTMNRQVTFRFKLVFTELTSECTINLPCAHEDFTWAQFCNFTATARDQIIPSGSIQYEIVVSGQPEGERAPALNPVWMFGNELSTIERLMPEDNLFNSDTNYVSMYIRPRNRQFYNYLFNNCPNTSITNNADVNIYYWRSIRESSSQENEGAQADSEDENIPVSSPAPEPTPEPDIEPSVEPTSGPTPEPTCENMDVDSNSIPTIYHGMCCVCFENRYLSDHWQCYIPEGSNRHGICDSCFNTYMSSRPSERADCPVCRQPLGDTNYGEVAPPTPPTPNPPPPTVYTHTISPPEPDPSVLQDFHSGGSGAAGPQDSEGAAGPRDHQNFLNNYNNWGWNNNINSNITTSAVYDYINNMQNAPTIEVRNQEIIIRNIPYNEMVELQRHNPNNNTVSGPSNHTLRDSLMNVISTQINNISNNNRLDTNIFNVSFYNTDNNNNPVG